MIVADGTKCEFISAVERARKPYARKKEEGLVEVGVDGIA